LAAASYTLGEIKLQDKTRVTLFHLWKVTKEGGNLHELTLEAEWPRVAMVSGVRPG